MGWVEKNKKKLLGKIKKNLLGGSLTVALPRKGEGVPLPVVSPTTCQNHTQYPFAKVTNVTHTNDTHKSHIKAPQKLNRSTKTYILIVKRTLSIYI